MSIAHSQEDPNKPFWILRLVTEHNEAEFFEVKKDVSFLSAVSYVEIKSYNCLAEKIANTFPYLF